MDTSAPLAQTITVSSDGFSNNQALVVTCLIGAQQYGLAIAVVQEIVRLPTLLSLPGAPPFLCGLLNLRGLHLPVLDGRRLLNEAPSYSLNNQIVIVGRERAEIGLLVDEVCAVRTLSTQQWTPFSQQTAATYLQGVVTTETGSVVLFDVGELLKLVSEATDTPLRQGIVYETATAEVPDGTRADEPIPLAEAYSRTGR